MWPPYFMDIPSSFDVVCIDQPHEEACGWSIHITSESGSYELTLLVQAHASHPLRTVSFCIVDVNRNHGPMGPEVRDLIRAQCPQPNHFLRHGVDGLPDAAIVQPQVSSPACMYVSRHRKRGWSSLLSVNPKNVPQGFRLRRSKVQINSEHMEAEWTRESNRMVHSFVLFHICNPFHITF